MGIEIERKFLVNKSQWAQTPKPAGIGFKQGYLLNDAGKTIRVRIAGNDAWLTIKGPSKGYSRKEYEYQIPVNDAAELLADMAGAVIEKTRYRINFAKKLWEVDVFGGENNGLIMAEIELEEESETFELPDWVLNEISGDVRYYNSYLSENPYCNWGV